MARPETIRFYRTNLPHWEVARGLYFVTMHVHGSLPKHVLRELKLIANQAKESNPTEKEALARVAFGKMEMALHADKSIDYLKRPSIAAICVDAINRRDSSSVWQMIEYVLMPNHIHLFFELTSGTLYDVMTSFKRWTTLQARPILQLRGSLWQHDWFDHWSRSPEEDTRIIEYIRNNPVKAGLVKNYSDWPYGSWSRQQQR